jgi:hypothetical protein
MAARKEIIERQRSRYKKARKKEKGAILESICMSTGLSRSRVKHILRASGSNRPKKRKPGRRLYYDAETRRALEKIWAYMDFASGRRLVAGMNDILNALIRHGETQYNEEIFTKLREMSASTADRLLKAAKHGPLPKGKSTTKPGTLLKRDIPLRLGNEWDDAVVGFVEIDLVAHCGETTAGDYLNTLDVTDICSGWTETAAVINKAQRHVFAALLAIEARQPFPYRGIDSDNGSEFINAHLYRYCKEHNICFTRSRPNRKNDNCHVEQKNWHVIRRNIGYGRYEDQAAVDAMNEYYALLRLHSNFFSPHSKLVHKERVNGRLRKRYDTPKTPYRRLLESEQISQETKKTLTETFTSLNPLLLMREMEQKRMYLETLVVKG